MNVLSYSIRINLLKARTERTGVVCTYSNSERGFEMAEKTADAQKGQLGINNTAYRCNLFSDL